jgi:hypothetical protein
MQALATRSCCDKCIATPLLRLPTWLVNYMQPSKFRQRAISWMREKVEDLSHAVSTAGSGTSLRRPLDCMELEDRTLFNASPMALVQGNPSPTGGSVSGTATVSPAAEAHGIDVVLIDSNLANSNLLAQAAAPGDKVILYDGVHESASQVLATVENWAKSTNSEIQSLSLLAHGVGGEFELGNQWISTSTLAQSAADWRQLGAFLAPGADIDLYGCDVAAAGSTGQALIDQIATLTGAQVFASTNVTGQGGDWTLEASSAGASPLSSTTGDTPLNMAILAKYTGDLGAAAPVGVETLVNSTTAGTQTTATAQPGTAQSIAADGSGNYVVTWTGTDSSGTGVLAQLYDASGNPIGSEFQVNTTTAGPEQDATVARSSNGQFAIFWSANASAPSGDLGIYGQLFDASGNPIGGELHANTYTSNNQQFPSVAMDANGNFVVVWQSQGEDGSGWGVYGQRFDSSGNQVGSEFQINTTTAGDQSNPSVAMDAAGDFVVTWQSDGQDGSGLGVYGQRYDASGAAQGGEFQINSTTADDQQLPMVAMNASGAFIVTWSSENQDGSGWGVYGQRYNSSGTAVGSEFQVNSTTSGDQEFSGAAMNSDGSFVITWSSNAQDGSGWGVYAQQYQSNGSTLGAEMQVNTTTSGDQNYSSVASLGNGNFAVVWSGYSAADDQGVYFQQYAPADQAPSLTVPAGQSVNDTSALTLSSGNGNQITVADSDSGGNAEQVTLTVNSGTLTLSGTSGLTFTSGSNGSASMTMQGTLANLDAALDGLTYTPPANLTDNASATLSVTINDLGNTGSGGPLTASNTVGITINHVDRAPVNTVPGAQTVGKNMSLVFSSGSGNQISVADSDSRGNAEQVQLSVADGTLSLSGTAGLTFTAGSNGSATMTMQGTIANIDAALSGLTYSPTANYTGADTLQITTNDLGNTGSGGPLSTSSSVSLNVTAMVNSLVVTTASDVSDGDTSSVSALQANEGADGKISLREAILAADNTPIATDITFNIPGAGVHTISLASALPVVDSYITIDATSQPGYGSSPLVRIDGASAGAGVDGLQLSGSSIDVYGLSITDFSQDGVLISGSNDILGADYIGIAADGVTAAGNAGSGVKVTGNQNDIGPNSVGNGNVISANGASGVLITGASATGNLVLGNYIGTNAAGTATAGSQSNGVSITSSASGNTVGSSTAGLGNVISGSTADGVSLSGAGTTGNSIIGNYIGTNAAGTGAVGNVHGISISSSATGNTIGGTAAGTGNVISGNSSNGILVQAASTTIEKNYLGTDVTGSLAVANLGSQIFVNGVANTVIGAAGAGNVISGGNVQGIKLVSATNTTIQGNYIGTNATGSSALGNGSDGILVSNSSNNTIGGPGGSVRNVISGNSGSGVDITGAGSTGNTVAGNYIGTNAAGSAALANSGDGVLVAAANNTVGGNASGTANFISGNAGYGVLVTGASATGTQILGNLIGLNVTQYTALGNGLDGIQINGASNTLIGAINGNPVGGGNIISGNNGYGVSLVNGTTGTTLLDNWIGVDYSGATAVANALGGMLVSNSSNNTIGGSVAGSGNVISGNTGVGLTITGASATGNVLENNDIGTNSAGTAAVANTGIGLLVQSGSNIIGGGGAAADRNVISGNGDAGIRLSGGSATNNLVQGNYIGVNAAGTAALGNANWGVMVDNGANNNFIGTNGDGTNDTAEGNVIAANSQANVAVQAANNNVIAGNNIGTNAAGTAALGGGIGVWITSSAVNTRIGTNADDVSDALERNVISGNSTGVRLDGSSTTTVVAGNYIGTNAAGTAAIANSADGVYILNAASNTIGGTAAASRNLISGNVQDGVEISGASATGNNLLGNYIGVNAAGTAALSNQADGVLIDNSANGNTIGGTTAGAGNVISGNLSNGIEIDGTVSNTLVEGNIVGLNAAGAAAIANSYQGIDVRGANNTIGGAAAGARNIISGNGGNGILIDTATANSNSIQANYIGTNAAGTAGLDNAASGVFIQGGTGTSVLDNLISGNAQAGVEIFSSSTSGNFVQGNQIGTNAAGSAAIANLTGVNIDGSANNQIGGTGAGQGNLISGNTGAGVQIQNSGASNNLIEGNLLGTTLTGMVALANLYGVVIQSGATGNTIGGTTASARNVISGNTNSGVSITSGSNTVEGNYIGTNKTGSAALANGADGVTISGGSGNVVGGTVAGAGNVISGNTQNGVNINGASTSANQVSGNYIGTGASGNVALGNATGITISGSASNIIGGTTAAARNVIAASSAEGIAILNAGATGNVVEGNYIGTNATGTVAFSNRLGVFIQGATNNTIGGTAAGASNLISGNQVGIDIFGSSTTNNTVEGNWIGTTATGNAALANSSGVLLVAGAANNLIGGTSAGAGNVIAGNSSDGIYINDGSSGNTIQGNQIGLNASGSALGNNVGVEIDGTTSNVVQNNLIGGTSVAARNIISGNIAEGVLIGGSNAMSNTVSGNYIGTDSSGTTPIANSGPGVAIFNGANGNMIGGTAAGAGNLIAFNTGAGVAIYNTTTVNDAVLGNQISQNAGLGIDLNNDGVTLNHTGGAIAGPNGLQNFPVLLSVSTSGSNTNLSGTFNSSANTTYRLEFFNNGASGDPSGYGQGATSLGATSVTTDANGNATFSAVLPVTTNNGDVISATATVDLGGGNYGGTSEFAQNLKSGAVDSAPVNTVPGTQTINENTSLVFSSANGNQISVADSDSRGYPEQVALVVLNGTLTLSGTTGLTFISGTGTGDASMQFTGTLTAINNSLNGMTYTPAVNFNGSDGLGITVNDLGNTGSGGPKSTTSGVGITVNHIDVAPVNTVPGAQSLNDNASLVFSSANSNQISIADSDSGGNAEQVTLSVGSGTLNLSSTAGLTLISGANGSASMTVQGTLANLNADLNGLTYTPPSTLTNNSSDTLSLVSNDLGNSGINGPLTANSTIALTLNHVDRVPVNTVPGPQSTSENISLVFSSATGNQISVADSDANGQAEQVTLAVGSGTLTLSGTTGLTFAAGSNGSAAMTIQGTLANLNAALNGLTYTPGGSFFGTDTLQITTGDLGNTGLGGPQSVSSSLSLSVNEVNQAPVNTTPGAQSINDNSPLVFSTAGSNQISIADVDSNGNLEQLSLSVGSGTLTLGSTAGLTIVAGANGTNSLTVQGTVANLNADLNGLTYTPTSTLTTNASDTLSLVTNDLGNTGLGGPLTASSTVAIALNHVDVAPVNTVPAAQVLYENSSLTFSTANGNQIAVSDRDANGSVEQVALSVGKGTLTLNGTTGVTIVAGSNGSAAMVLQGTIANIDAALNGLVYAPTANTAGSDMLHISTNDLGNTGQGGPQVATDTVGITVNAGVPVINVPGPQQSSTMGVIFSTAGGNPITVAFANGGSGLVQVSLLATNGTITLASTSGLTFTSGGGAGGTSMVFSGSDSAVNAALNGLNFQPTSLSASLQITAANPASGAPLTSTVSLSITQIPLAPPGSRPAPAPVPAPSPATATASQAPAPPKVAQQPVTQTHFVSSARPISSGLAPFVNPVPASPISALAIRAQSEMNAANSEVNLAARSPKSLVTTRRNSSNAEMTMNEIDSLMKEIRIHEGDNEFVIGAVSSVGAALSAGYVVWALRAGALLASALSSLPAWVSFDPLPVLEFWEKDKADKQAKDKDDDLGDPSSSHADESDLQAMLARK